MEKYLKDYIKYISDIDGAALDDYEREKLKSEMLIRISFFQHERLVHLIVTVLFALLTVFMIVCCRIFTSIPFLILAVLLLILLIPYIRHYYILENGVQKLYSLYEKL